MRRSLLAVMTIALAFGGAAPIEAEQGTHCSFEFVVTLTPGFLMMEPSSGTHGGTGPATCDGPVNGKQPTGAGTLSDYGAYDASTCPSGKGSGVDTIKIPTADGIETVVSNYTFTSGGKLPTHGRGLAGGEFEGDRFSGSFEFMPLEGDCITTPLIKAKVFGEGIIHR